MTINCTIFSQASDQIEDKVVNIFSPLRKKQKIMDKLQDNLEANIKGKDDHDVLSQGFFGEVKKKKKKDKHFLKTTLNSLHDNYFGHNLQQNNQKNIEVLNFTKKKMMTHILGFTNNLVHDDLVR